LFRGGTVKGLGGAFELALNILPQLTRIEKSLGGVAGREYITFAFWGAFGVYLGVVFRV
jgi:hypothetical protein